MPNESIQSFAKINPLVGLPVKTLRLYNALEVLKKKYRSSDKPEWFFIPERDPLLQKIGFSKTEIETGLKELKRVNLLLTREEQNTCWYCLK
jgi:DNA-binding transcriptional MerR regulator